MAYGDTFGGVQAAAQAQDRSRSADYFNALQAQRAADALNLNALQADRSYGLQMRQMNDAAQARDEARRLREQEQAAGDARYGLEYLTRLGDTAFNRDTTLENQALQRDQFDLNKAAQDQKLLTQVDAVHNTGAALATDLGDAVAKRAEAAKKLGEIETYSAKLKQAAVTNKLTNPQWGPRIQSILTGLADQQQAAKRDLATSDYLFKKATSQAVNLGFIPQGDKLVHGRTGKTFSMLPPQVTAPEETGNADQFDANAAPVAPQPVPQPAPSSNSAVNYFMRGARALGILDTPTGGNASAMPLPQRFITTLPSAPSRAFGSSQIPGYLNQRVRVQDPNGRKFSVPESQVQEALDSGYTLLQ